MGKILENLPNAEPAAGDYPFGQIKDHNGPSDPGTPINQLTCDGIFQFFMKMAAEAGLELNDLPDNSANGFQYFDAMFRTATAPIIHLFGTYTGTELPSFAGDDLGALVGKYYIRDRKAYICDATNDEIRVFATYGAYLDTENFGSGILTNPGLIQLVGDKAYVYNNAGDIDVFTVSTGAHIPAESFTLNNPVITMFIVPSTDRIYGLTGANIEAHVLSTGAYIPGESFAVGGALQVVSDLFIAYGKAYVVNTTSQYVEVYTLSTGVLDTTFGSSTLINPLAIFGMDRNHISYRAVKLYVVDVNGVTVWVDGGQLPEEAFTLDNAATFPFISDGVFYYMSSPPQIYGIPGKHTNNLI